MPDRTPLVVDLDGTLLNSDHLMECVFAYLSRNPAGAFLLVVWLLKGKIYFKSQIAFHMDLRPDKLPYNAHVLQHIEQARESRRPVILATAAHRRHANQIAEHLGLFDEVLATSDVANLSGSTKRQALVDRFGESGFDYVGNAAADLPIWEAARTAHIVNASPSVERDAKKRARIGTVIQDQTQSSYIRLCIQQLRLHQWLKNLLIFVPLIAAHGPFTLGNILVAISAFLSFSLAASSVYILNDLLDLQADRDHPTKCGRPLASGQFPLAHAVVLSPLLLVSAGTVAVAFLPWSFGGTLGIYYLLTLGYSLYFKEVVLVDAITLALLYTVRIIAGAMALSLSLTGWILAFSLFIFWSLALVKRYTELIHLRERREKQESPGRGYHHADLEMLGALGGGSGCISVMVLALYIQSEATKELYANPQLIWLACPLLLYWISRTWLIAHRGEMHQDPVIFAATDRVSLLVGILFLSVFAVAT